MVPKPKLDAAGKPVPFLVAYPEKDDKGNFLSHPTAASVVGMHNFAWMFIQATVAILILVGFESVTAMGGEAKNAKRDVPIAVITSLLVQGAFCYLIEYFAANYFLSSGYTMQNASGSSAPIGDMMVIIGNHFFGQGGGRIFMLVEAVTVVLALIGTTLSCMNTGARVTYAMGKDDEDRRQHSACCTPRTSLLTAPSGPWPTISAVIGCISVAMLFGDAPALERCHHQGAAAGLLLQLRLSVSRCDGGHAQQPAHGHAGVELRHLPALRAQLRHLHGGVPQPPDVQPDQAPVHSGLRAGGESGLHGVLSDRSVHGIRHQDGTAVRARNRRRLGHLRRHILPLGQQEERQNDAGGRGGRRATAH